MIKIEDLRRADFLITNKQFKKLTDEVEERKEKGEKHVSRASVVREMIDERGK